MTKQMAMGCTSTPAAALMKASGLMTYRMALAEKHGSMDHYTRASTATAKSMVLDLTTGQTTQNILVSGTLTILVVSVFINGLMADVIKGNGLITIWKELVLTNGKRVGRTLENLSRIKNMDMEFINGPMVVSIKVIGKMDSSTVWASTLPMMSKKKRKPMVSGKTVNESPLSIHNKLK